MKRLIPLSCVFLILSSVHAYAATTTKAKADMGKWTGTAQLGVISNSGNSTDTNINGGVTLNYDTQKWKNTGTFKGQLSSNKSGLSARNYDALVQTSYYFLPKDFGYGRAEYNIDTFSAYKYRLSYSGGYGRRLYDNNGLTIDVQAGPGMVTTKETDTNKTNNEFTLYTQGTLNWKISDNVSFEQTISTSFGHPDVYTQAVSALNTKIVGNLGMQVSYTIKHHSYIPSDTDKHKTDTITNITLVYSFL